MSTVLENVTAANDAAAATESDAEIDAVIEAADGAVEVVQVKGKRWKPSGKKVYKPRMATKVRWALEDSMERSIAAQKEMRKVLEWLEETHGYDIDERGRAHLGKLQLHLFALALEVSELERILANAIHESKTAAGNKQE
jgi:hypothetical protein